MLAKEVSEMAKNAAKKAADQVSHFFKDSKEEKKEAPYSERNLLHQRNNSDGRIYKPVLKSPKPTPPSFENFKKELNPQRCESPLIVAPAPMQRRVNSRGFIGY